jgi:hypothetical protein
VFATKLRGRNPDAKMYAIASLSQDNAGATDPIPDTRYDVVVLSADETSVTVHDPYSGQEDGARRILDKTDFAGRWAVMLNRAHIIIAS